MTKEVAMLNHHEPKIDDLTQVPLFRSCTKAELRELAQITTETTVAKGHVMCTEGQAGHRSIDS